MRRGHLLTSGPVLALLLAIGMTTAPAPARADDAAGQLRAVAAEHLEQAPGDGMTIPGRDGWLFFRGELRHLASGAVAPEGAAENMTPAAVIADFARQLEAQNIELILVPLPPKAAVYPHRLDPRLPADASPADLLPRHAELYEQLRQQGVRVLDLAGPLAELATEQPAYCMTDTHWSGAATQLAAAKLAEELRQRDWYAQVPREQFATQARQVSIAGDLRGALPPPLPEQEMLELRFVGRETSTSRGEPTLLHPIEPQRSSPVLLLGDSHNLIFHAGGDMHARGAGLPDQLAAELGFAVDLIAVRGSGATPARISLARAARADAAYLPAKRVVIWCFTARELTEARWQMVPLLPGG